MPFGPDIERTLRLPVTLKQRDGSADPASRLAASSSRARRGAGPGAGSREGENEKRDGG